MAGDGLSRPDDCLQISCSVGVTTLARGFSQIFQRGWVAAAFSATVGITGSGCQLGLVEGTLIYPPVGLGVAGVASPTREPLPFSLFSLLV